MTDDIGTNRNNNLDDTSSDSATESDSNSSDQNSGDKNSNPSRTGNSGKSTGSGSVPGTTGGDAEISKTDRKPSAGTGTLDENEQDDSTGDMSEIEKSSSQRRDGSNGRSQE